MRECTSLANTKSMAFGTNRSAYSVNIRAPRLKKTAGPPNLALRYNAEVTTEEER